MGRPSKYSDDPKERDRLKSKAWRERNPERVKEISKTNYERNGHKRRIESGCRRGQNYYQTRKEFLLEKANKVRKENKQWAIDFLGGVCVVCKQSYPLVCYDFHHKDPTEKDHLPCRLLQGSRDKLQKEIEKCELVCANCHRIIHHEQGK